MSTGLLLVLLACCVLVVVGVVMAVVLTIRLTRGVHWSPDTRYDGERWRVRTPHGRVYVTRIIDEAGPGYLIDARFRSGRLIETQPPAILAARQRVDAMVAAEGAR